MKTQNISPRTKNDCIPNVRALRAKCPMQSRARNSARRRWGSAAVILFAAIVCGYANLQAATVLWTSALNAYTNKPSWSSGAVPLPADTATVGNATTPTGSVLYTNAPPDPAANNSLTSLLLGNAANASGTFTMSAGTLSITNTSTTALILGNANPSTGNFVMNGGNLNVVRNASTFFQDSFQPGFAVNSAGNFTLNSGTATFLAGVEIGIQGVGTININGGTFIDSGWFGLGRGGTAIGSGIFNLTSGTAYLLRNPGTEGATSGISYCQGGTNGSATISGGVLYVNVFNFSAPSGPNHADTENLTISGGDIYVGGGGFVKGTGAGAKTISINLSGGTFHTVNLGPNTGGVQGLASVGTGGTNWSWAAALSGNLANSPGAGIVTFAPEAGRTITLNAPFSGPGGLALPGPGTVVIGGANTYTGLTTVSGGTLAGTGSIQGDVTESVGSQIAPGTSLAPGTLTFGNTVMNNTTNIIKLSADPTTIGGGVNDLIMVNGNVTLQNVSTIKVVPLGALSTSTPYTILQYTGTQLTTADAAHLHVISDSPRYNFTVVDPATTPGSIQIAVTGNAASLLWRGGVSANPTAWDHVTTNWLNKGTSALDFFFNGDATAFNDSATTNLVTIIGTEQATAIVMSNNAVNFTFAGGGPLSGPLDLEGTGTLTLAMSNAPAFTAITANSGTLVFGLQGVDPYAVAGPISDNGLGNATLIKTATNTMVLQGDNSSFNGKIYVTNGVLQYTNATGLGVASSPLYVTNTGTLDLNGAISGLKNIIISGNGLNGRGALINSVGNALINNNGVNNVTLAGDASVGAANRFDFYQNSFNGNGFTLTEIGPGSNIIVDDGETALGDIHIVAGRLGFQGNVTMGDPAKTITVESNTVLTFFSLNNVSSTNGGETKTFVLKGSAALDSGGASNNLNGPIFLTGTNLIGTRGTLHLWGNIANTNGTGGILLGNDSVGASGGDLWLDGVNTYTGSTLVTNRTLFLGVASTPANSPLILITTPGKLDVTSMATFSLGAGQKLAGNGTVTGNTVSFGSGSTLAPGLPGTNASALTMNATLALQSGSTNLVVVNKTGTLTNGNVTGLTAVTMGGTLVINSFGNPLTAGDAIPLFTSGSYAGGFSFIIPTTPGTGLAWDSSTLTSDGTLRVISSGPNPSPTNIVYSFSGSQLTLSWPSDHTGWTLQAQTNGIGTNWFTVPGSSGTNQIVIPIDVSKQSVFYRMILNP